MRSNLERHNLALTFIVVQNFNFLAVVVLEDVARTKILVIKGKKKKRKRKNVNMGTETNSRGGSKPKIVSPFSLGFEARAACLNLQPVFQFLGWKPVS